MPKGPRLEASLSAAAQLGVRKVFLALSERTVHRPKGGGGGKLERLRKVLREASRQSEQAHCPSLEGPLPLAQIAAEAPPGALRIALAARGGASWGDLSPPPGAEIWLFVGPEGGFSEAEWGFFRELGIASMHLRTGILRVETAVAVGLGLLRELTSAPRPAPAPPELGA